MRWCDLCRFLKVRSGNMSCHNCPYIYLKLNLHYINQHQSNIIFPYAQKSSVLMWQLSLFTIINYLDSKIPSYTWSIFFFLVSITCSRKENSVVRYAGSFINIFTVDLKVSEHSQVGSEQWMKSQSLGEDVVHKTWFIKCQLSESIGI